IWSPSATPAVADYAGNGPIELGVKFTSDISGYITGVRFYKGSTAFGSNHLGSLWDANGNLLASATFTGESNSAWQQVSFAIPVAITANTTYVAGYFAANAHFAYTQNTFTNAGVDNGVLHALSDPAAGGNGVYATSSTSVFPTSSYLATN